MLSRQAEGSNHVLPKMIEKLIFYGGSKEIDMQMLDLKELQSTNLGLICEYQGPWEMKIETFHRKEVENN